MPKSVWGCIAQYFAEMFLLLIKPFHSSSSSSCLTRIVSRCKLVWHDRIWFDVIIFLGGRGGFQEFEIKFHHFFQRLNLRYINVSKIWFWHQLSFKSWRQNETAKPNIFQRFVAHFCGRKGVCRRRPARRDQIRWGWRRLARREQIQKRHRSEARQKM